MDDQCCACCGEHPAVEGDESCQRCLDNRAGGASAEDLRAMRAERDAARAEVAWLRARLSTIAELARAFLPAAGCFEEVGQ